MSASYVWGVKCDASCLCRKAPSSKSDGPNRAGDILFQVTPLLLSTDIEQIDEPYTEACGHRFERLKGRVGAAIFDQAHGRLLDIEFCGQFILSPTLGLAQPTDIS